MRTFAHLQLNRWWALGREVLNEEGEYDVILPAAIDADESPRKPLAPESDLFEETHGRAIMRQARGFQAM